MNIQDYPAEIQFKVFEKCNVGGIVNLSGTCKYYAKLKSEEYDYVWKIYMKELEINTYSYIDEFNKINITDFPNYYTLLVYIYGLLINEKTLIYECVTGHIDVCKYMIGRGINLKCCDEVFFDVCKNKHYDMAIYLIDTYRNEENICALMGYACEYGCEDIIEYVVRLGIDLHVYDENYLWCACYCGQLNIVKYLIRKGANIYADKGSCIIGASERGYLDIVEYLIELGMDIHVKNDSALISAAAHGHLEVVKCLIHNRKKDMNYDEALIEAAKNGYGNIIRYLYSLGGRIPNNELSPLYDVIFDYEYIRECVERALKV